MNRTKIVQNRCLDFFNLPPPPSSCHAALSYSHRWLGGKMQVICVICDFHICWHTLHIVCLLCHPQTCLVYYNTMLGILAGSSVMLMPQGQGFVMYRNYCLLETRRERDREQVVGWEWEMCQYQCCQPGWFSTKCDGSFILFSWQRSIRPTTTI